LIPNKPKGKPPGESLKCKGCGKTFINTQGLGAHETNCPQAKAFLEQKKQEETDSLKPQVFAPPSDNRKLETLARKEAAIQSAVMLPTEAPTPSSEEDPTSHATVPKKDGRKSNRGAATRESIDNKTKHDHLERCDVWLSEDETRTVAQHCKHFHPKECDKWNNRLSQWRKKQTDLVQVESDRLHGKLKIT